jgi:hypothetical protein
VLMEVLILVVTSSFVNGVGRRILHVHNLVSRTIKYNPRRDTLFVNVVRPPSEFSNVFGYLIED